MMLIYVWTRDIFPKTNDNINGKASYGQNKVHDLNNWILLIAYIVEYPKNLIDNEIS